jgi:UDP-MurNAc hydroxylase
LNITHLGHAGLKVETVRSTVLMDPWFSPEGAFQASWFQYPDNSHLIAPSLFEPTTLIISHEHMDHLDPWFLAQVPSYVPVIIPRYPSPVLRRKILSAGHRDIIEVSTWELIDLPGGGNLFFVGEDSPVNHDAAVIIQIDGRTLVNMNDALLSPVQIREIRAKVGQNIDFLCLQAAGASWYPMCYEYPDGRRHELSRRKRLAKLAYAARIIKVAQPVVALPFAGPPCFLDPELFGHNAEMETGIFPDQQQVKDWLAKHGVTNTLVLMPGDTWNLERRSKQADPTWADFSFANRLPYLEAYAKRRRSYIESVRSRYPEPSASLWADFRAYFEALLAMSHYFNGKIGMRVGFDITGPGGGEWSVDFRPGFEGVFDTFGDCAYRYQFASRWLPPLLAGTVPWEDFFLSLRFQAWREPDLYNDHLLGLLKFAHPEALRAVERFESSVSTKERIMIHAEGRTYRIQRHCPHAGHDLLESGEVLSGRILRCLAHHYEFDLETGECVNGSCVPLATESVEQDQLQSIPE